VTHHWPHYWRPEAGGRQAAAAAAAGSASAVGSGRPKQIGNRRFPSVHLLYMPYLRPTYRNYVLCLFLSTFWGVSREQELKNTTHIFLQKIYVQCHFFSRFRVLSRFGVLLSEGSSNPLLFFVFLNAEKSCRKAFKTIEKKIRFIFRKINIAFWSISRREARFWCITKKLKQFDDVPLLASDLDLPAYLPTYLPTGVPGFFLGRPRPHLPVARMHPPKAREGGGRKRTGY
jgi:hypothetical protein